MAKELETITAEAELEEAATPEGGALIDLFITLVRYKRVILGVTLGATLVASTVALLLPNVYRSTAVIMAPEPHIPAASLLTGMPMWGWGGVDAWSLSDPNEKYVSMLYGETVGRRLIERLDLQERYSKNTIVDTLKLLRQQTDVVSERTGVIRVSFEDKDPQFAAQAANAYIEEFQNLLSRMAAGSAQQKRRYFEGQLAAAREQLAAAELSLIETQKVTGLIVPAVQTEALVRSIAQVRAEITVREAQLRQLRTYATEQNPEVVGLRQQISAFRSELATLEGSGTKERVAISGLKSDESMEYLRRAREVAYFEMLVELLAKQAEGARVDENTPPSVPIVDRAQPADKKHKPRRLLIVTFTFVIAGFFSLLMALGQDSFRRAQRDRVFAEKVRRLKIELYRRHSASRLEGDL